MKTPPKKKGGARHVDLWHDVSQTFSCLHEIYPNDLCQIIRPHQTSRGILPKNTSSKFHPPCAWRSKKCKSLRSLPPQREPWSAPARSVVTEAVDTEAAAAVVAGRKRTFHRPRRSIPMCGGCALWAAFRSGTADSSDWPAKSGPDVLKRPVNQ